MKTEERVYTFLFQYARWCTVSNIAEKTGIPKSSVQKALTKLRNANKVERDLGAPGQGYLWYA